MVTSSINPWTQSQFHLSSVSSEHFLGASSPCCPRGTLERSARWNARSTSSGVKLSHDKPRRTLFANGLSNLVRQNQFSQHKYHFVTEQSRRQVFAQACPQVTSRPDLCNFGSSFTTLHTGPRAAIIRQCQSLTEGADKPRFLA